MSGQLWAVNALGGFMYSDELSNVMRINLYTTDVDRFREEASVLFSRLSQSGCKPVVNLLGVVRLALPEFLVEIEATAVA